LPEYIEVSIA